MIYIKCRRCPNVHSIYTPNSFSHCHCGSQMELIRVTDEQHREAVNALQKYLNKLVALSLNVVQGIKGESQLPKEYESWSANWLLENSAARRSEEIEYVCDLLGDTEDKFKDDKVFDAAHWATLTADAAARAVSLLDKGNIHDMLWWLGWIMENYYTKKTEVMTLLKEKGYDVTI